MAEMRNKNWGGVMKTESLKLKTQNFRNGSMLALVIIAMVLLTVMGMGLLSVAYGVRLGAIRLKNEAVARLAAEAGYEQALYWMSQQKDMLSALQKGVAGTTGTLTFPDGDCDYQIQLFSFVGSQPIYRVISTGHSGAFTRTTDVWVLQAISGWDMGQCRVPSGKTSTQAVYFVNGEIIDIPLHINNLKDKPDNRDIYITGSPHFLQLTGMGESQYAGKTDKYASVMGLFEGGIDFDQPDCKITDETVIQSKVDRFKDSTASSYKFTPTASTSVSTPREPAVQLEFFVDGGVGKVRITNNCTVQADNPGDYDYSVVPGSSPTKYQKYNIYAYHFKSTSEAAVVIPLTDTYVTQSFGGVQSEPGGQIYIKGNVVIGSSDYTNMVVKGKITIVAARRDDGTGGNIWVADSIVVDGAHDATSGMPTTDNPNVLGLIAQNVVKVVNPTSSTPSAPSGLTYQPIGITKSGYTGRFLSDPTVVEAAITVGGGGWGAENVGNRREYSGSQDDLVVRGSIAEVLRGVVGLSGSDGYLKHYYLDKRLLEGILPGDIWLRGKYIPAPAGWHDYRASN